MKSTSAYLLSLQLGSIHPHDVVTNSILDEVNTIIVNGLKTYIADELEQCVKDAVYPTP
jgi:hypothetical protein